MGECITNISFHKGLPTELDSFAEGCKHNLVTLDDLMNDVVRETEMQKAIYPRCTLLKVKHDVYYTQLFKSKVSVLDLFH